MIQEIKEKFPTWAKDKETKFELMMSDDIDALMCYQMQKYNYERECEYFMNSSKKKAYKGSYGEKTGEQYFYKTTDATVKQANLLCLDFSIDKNTKSWDNHVAKITSDDKYNTLSANMNTVCNISSDNYSSKYCISSFITMLSYYDIHIQNWTHEQLICLAAIDGLYQPFKNIRFEHIGSKNLKNLEYDFLIDFIKDNLREIERFDNKYCKNKSIWVNDGYLKTNINLNKLSEIFNINIALPNKKFELISKFESRVIETDTFKNKSEIEKYYNKKIFNIAMTYRKSGVVSFMN